MKKVTVLLLFLAMVAGLCASTMLMKTLPNGMSVVIKQNTQNPTVGVFCFVKTGSMHEGKYLGSGISHYVEHVVSGGTTSKHTEQEYTDMTKLMGSSTNAFTSLDRTAYLSVSGKEHFQQALQNISDYVQHCVFDSTEVAREQQVISKEIILGSAQTPVKMHYRVGETFAPESNASYPVIGRPELFMRLTRQDLIDYYKARYVPNNMVLVIVGDVDPDMAMQEAEAAFAGFPRGFVETPNQPPRRIIQGKREVLEEFEVLQPRVFIKQVIPAGETRDVYLLSAATEMLFNKESSPLQKKLQQDLKLVSFIYAYAYENPAENSAELTILFDARQTEDIPRILELMYEEFSFKKKKSYFTHKMLNSLIAKYESEKYLKSRDVDDECNEIGDSMLSYGVPDADQIWLDVLNSINPAEVDEVIRKYLNPNNKFTFYGLPLGETFKLRSADAAIYARTDLKKIELNNKLTLLHKQNAEYPVVRGTVMIPVSSFYESADNYQIISFMTSLLQKGSKKYPKDVWTDWLDEHSASLNIFSHSYGTYIRFTCLERDLPQMLDMVQDAIKNPLFMETEIALLKADWEGNAKRMEAIAQSANDDFRTSKAYSSLREQITNLQKVEISNRFTRQDVLTAYRKYLKAENMIVAMVGSTSEAEASKIAQTLLSAFDTGRIDDTIKPPVLSRTNTVYRQEYSFEHAFVDIMMSCPGTDDKDFVVMKAIDALLNYGDRRLHHATRVERDLAYYASANSVAIPGYGMFRVSSQSSEDKIDELRSVLEREINRLITEPVTNKELTEAVDNYLNQHKNFVSDEWLGYMAIMFEAQGLGYDFFINEASILKQVKPEDIQRVAAKYMTSRDTTISVPSKDVKRIMPD